MTWQYMHFKFIQNICVCVGDVFVKKVMLLKEAACQTQNPPLKAKEALSALHWSTPKSGELTVRHSGYNHGFQ